MVIYPVRGTYKRVSIFFISRTKKAFKLPSWAIFTIVKFRHLFIISKLTQKFQFLWRMWQIVTSTISGTCHFGLNLAKVPIKQYFFRKIFSDTLVYGLWYQMRAPYLVVRSWYFDFFSKYVIRLYVSSEGHISTYRYFFAQERKKPFNYQVGQHLRLLYWHICLQLLSFPKISISFANLSHSDKFNRRYMSPRG